MNKKILKRLLITTIMTTMFCGLEDATARLTPAVRNILRGITVGIFALIISTLAWNEADCQFRANATAVAACRDSNTTDQRLKIQDHIVLYAIGEPDSANILAAWLNDGTLMFLESGTSSAGAHEAMNEIVRWNDSIRSKVVSMSTLIATYAAGSLKIQAGSPLEKDLMNRIEGFLQDADAPINADHDQRIVDGLDAYARDASNAAREPVFNRQHLSDDDGDENNTRVTWSDGYNSWLALKQQLTQHDRIDNERLKTLIRILSLPTSTYINAPDWAATDDEKRGYMWLRKAMHTEIQLQILAKNRIITLASERPILSAYRPCDSCSRTSAVRLWCSGDSNTPFFCTWSDSTHLHKNTDGGDGTHLTAIKQPKGGLGQAWRVTLGNTDNNAYARKPKATQYAYPACGI